MNNGTDLPIRTCAEGKNGEVVVQIVNNRPYSVTLAYGLPVSFGWHQIPGDAAGATGAALGDALAGPNELYIAPLSSASVGIPRPNSYGLGLFQAKVDRHSLAADVIALIMDQLDGKVVRPSIMGKLAATCSGVLKPGLNGAPEITKDALDVIGKIAGCVETALPQLAAAGALDSVNLAKLKHAAQLLSGIIKGVVVGKLAGTLADLYAFSKIKDVKLNGTFTIRRRYEGGQAPGDGGGSGGGDGSGDGGSAPQPPPLGPVRSIPVRTVPGAAWSVGINDDSVAVSAPGDRVIASTVESTADLASDPLVQLFTPNGTRAWAAPTNIDHTTWGVPPVVTDRAGNTYFGTLETDGTFAFKSVDPTGRVRWVQPTPDRASAAGTSGINPVIGSNGVVYFAYWHGFSSAVAGFDMVTGRPALNLGFRYLAHMSAYAGGLVFVDLSAGNYEPVAKYYSYAGNLQYSYQADPKVSANTGASSYALGPDGSVLIAGVPLGTSCSSYSAPANFSVQKITPAGSAWVWTDPNQQRCQGGSALAPDGSNGAYIATEVSDGTSAALQRVDSGGALQWTRSINPLISHYIGVDVNGVAVTNTRYPFACSQGAPPDSCTGSEILFFARSGLSARPSIQVRDPDFRSYYKGLTSIAIGAGAIYGTRSSGDYHEETGSISRFDAVGLGSDYRVSIASG